MLMLLFIILISFFLSFAVALIGSLASYKKAKDFENLSPFECGFSSQMSHRSLFSVQFFLICLIFVIFDVELVVLFPLMSMIPESASAMESWIFFVMLILLTFGLLWEWSLGMLEWVY